MGGPLFLSNDYNTTINEKRKLEKAKGGETFAKYITNMIFDSPLFYPGQVLESVRLPGESDFVNP